MDILESIREIPIEYGGFIGLLACSTFYILLRRAFKDFSGYDEQ